MLLLLLACAPASLDRPAAVTPTRPSPGVPSGRSLDLSDEPPTELVLPPSSRPGGAPPPEDIPLAGRFAREGDPKAKGQVWRIGLPVGPDLLPTKTKGTHQFGSQPPPGLVVRGPDGELPFERKGRKPGTYGFDRESLFVGLPVGAPPPDPSRYSVTFERATTAERALNLEQSGLTADAFVHRTVTVDGTSHRGLFLPAPARVVYTVTVPDRGRFSFRHTVLPPAVRGAEASDGARVRVAVDDGGGETELAVLEARLGHPIQARVDLSRFAGREVRLVVTTDGGEHPELDYVFLEDPAVYSASEHPRRVLMVFVDTTRPDHLGFMGYERDTTPMLDHWAANAAVFGQARSVAPWTLPSTRAVLTGNQPEQWFASETLAEVFASAGWRTDAIVGNAFLSQPFDVERGWASYRYEHLLSPPQIVDAGIEALQAEPDRDSVVLVHFMGPHLPWDEPFPFLYLWARGQPDALRSNTRSVIASVQHSSKSFEEVRDYVTARYDQNLRWTDWELRRLLDAAGSDATVVFFSDHGEELWDHDDFEHGHSFYDELLRVPLAIKSPGLPAGRYDAPVSLLDVLPTLRELEGLSPADAALPGMSLVGYAWGEQGRQQALEARPQAFGRPLYGEDGWGVIDQGHKWTARAGAQTVYDLTTDPGESVDLAGASELGGYPDALSGALGRPVRLAWRLRLHTQPWSHALELTVSHPGGLEQVWSGYDPRGKSAGTVPRVVDGRVVMTVDPKEQAPDTLFLVPVGDPLDPGGLAVTLVGRGVTLGGTAPPGRVEPKATAEVFLSAKDARFGVLVDLTVVPEPDGVEVSGFHPDLQSQLEELGYLEE